MASVCRSDHEEEKTRDDGNNYSQQTEEEFQAWVLQEMTLVAPQVRDLYPTVFVRASEAVGKWRRRYRGNGACWNRLFKPDRVLKEVIESVPVIDAVLDWMDRHQDEASEKIILIDLCSGKGYLSMLLSDMVPPDRVEKSLLIDKAWPLCHSQPKPHHMSWDHIYGSYFDTWPVPLVTSKQDLKQSRTIAQLKERLANTQAPVLVLGVHLCGTLSLQAIKLFLALPSAQMLVLKPCCLPEMAHAKNADVFQVGGYCFPTNEVCAPGKWTQSDRVWIGPPRWHLQPKFETWCRHLHRAMDQEKTTTTARSFQVPIQTKGGFQNTFLIAERIQGL